MADRPSLSDLTSDSGGIESEFGEDDGGSDRDGPTGMQEAYEETQREDDGGSDRDGPTGMQEAYEETQREDDDVTGAPGRDQGGTGPPGGFPDNDNDTGGGAPEDDDVTGAPGRDQGGTGPPGGIPDDGAQEPAGPDLSEQDVPTRVDLDELRYAREDTTIAGVDYQRGEALPPEEQIARDYEQQYLEESDWRDRNLGGSDVTVRRGDSGQVLTAVRPEAIQRERREEVARQVEELGVTDIERVSSGGAVQTTPEFQQEQQQRRQQMREQQQAELADQFREGVGMPGWERGRQFTIEEETVSAADAAVLGAGASAINEVLPGLGLPDQPVDAGTSYWDVELTPMGREQYTKTQIAGQIEGGEGPTIGGEEVTELGQLQFDEQGDLTSVTEAEGPSFLENVQTAASTGGIGLPEAIGVAATREGLDAVSEASGTAADWTTENFVEPGAGTIGHFFSPEQRLSLSTEEPDTEINSPAEQFAAGLGTGAVGTTIGLPEQLETTGSTVGAGGAFAVQNPEAAPAAGAAFAAGVATETAEAAAEQPSRFAGTIAGGSITGAALSPLRFSRIDVPRTGAGTRLPRPTRPGVDIDTPSVSRPSVSIGDRITGTTQRTVDIEGPSVSGGFDVDITGPGLTRPSTTAVRGLRLRDPIAFERVTGRSEAGDTLIGFRGARPTVGAPEIDPGTVNFGELPGRGQTFEPVGGFESEVYGASVRGAGGQAARRFEAREGLMDIGERTEGELQLETTEEIVGEARAVPGSATGDVARALEDLGATIEGSAAVRAQLDEGFRQPRDLDILVEDKPTAKLRLFEALEGRRPPRVTRGVKDRVGDVFDMKVAGEGRPDPGEFVKGGLTAHPRLETEGGVQVTQIGEELVRKSSASGFLRGPGSPVSEFTGRTGGFDVGPEPVWVGKQPRFKDPADAFEIGRAVAPESEAVRTFGREFESEIVEADRGPSQIAFDEEAETPPPETPALFGGTGTGFRQFLADERGQATFGFGRRADIDRRRTEVADDVGTDVDPGRPARQQIETESPTRVDSGMSPGVSPAFGGSPAPGVVSGGVSQPSPGPSGVSPSNPFATPSSGTESGGAEYSLLPLSAGETSEADVPFGTGETLETNIPLGAEETNRSSVPSGTGRGSTAPGSTVQPPRSEPSSTPSPAVPSSVGGYPSDNSTPGSYLFDGPSSQGSSYDVPAIPAIWIPGDPGTPRQPRSRDNEGDREDERDPEFAPWDTMFQNPIASGAGALGSLFGSYGQRPPSDDEMRSRQRIPEFGEGFGDDFQSTVWFYK